MSCRMNLFFPNIQIVSMFFLFSCFDIVFKHVAKIMKDFAFVKYFFIFFELSVGNHTVRDL